MKYWISVMLVLALCTVVAAQDHSAHTQAKPATLMSGLGISTIPCPPATGTLRSSSIRDCG